MSVIDQAVTLGSQGLPVFPCSRTKRPTCPNGFYDAVLKAADVKALWKEHPGPLIGVSTGNASGLDVLDVDPRHGGEKWWFANEHRLPETRLHRTGGGGLHALFKHAEPVRNTSSTIAKGVDTRGEGGYVIWWPAHDCKVTAAPLAAWPAWLLDRLQQPVKPAQTPTRVYAPLAGADAAQRIANRVLTRLASASEGQRHYTLRKAAFTLGGLLDHLPFSQSEAEGRLLRAVQQAGAADLANAAKTAAWAIECGKKTPFRLEDRP